LSYTLQAYIIPIFFLSNVGIYVKDKKKYIALRIQKNPEKKYNSQDPEKTRKKKKTKSVLKQWLEKEPNPR